MTKYKFIKAYWNKKVGDVVEGTPVGGRIQVDINAKGKTGKQWMSVKKGNSYLAEVIEGATSDASTSDGSVSTDSTSSKLPIIITASAALIGLGAGFFFAWKTKKTMMMKVAFSAAGAVVLGGIGFGVSKFIGGKSTELVGDGKAQMTEKLRVMATAANASNPSAKPVSDADLNAMTDKMFAGLQNDNEKKFVMETMDIQIQIMQDSSKLAKDDMAGIMKLIADGNTKSMAAATKYGISEARATEIMKSLNKS